MSNSSVQSALYYEIPNNEFVVNVSFQCLSSGVAVVLPMVQCQYYNNMYYIDLTNLNITWYIFRLEVNSSLGLTSTEYDNYDCTPNSNFSPVQASYANFYYHTPTKSCTTANEFNSSTQFFYPQDQLSTQIYSKFYSRNITNGVPSCNIPALNSASPSGSPAAPFPYLALVIPAGLMILITIIIVAFMVARYKRRVAEITKKQQNQDHRRDYHHADNTNTLPMVRTDSSLSTNSSGTSTEVVPGHMEEVTLKPNMASLSQSHLLKSKPQTALSPNSRPKHESMTSTLLNTQAEISLPGYLRIDYKRQLRVEDSIASGGNGVLYRGVILDDDLRQRLIDTLTVSNPIDAIPEDEVFEKEAPSVPNDITHVAVKHVPGIAKLSDSDNQIIFEQEVAAMSALAFHPSIIRLIGYSENPRCLITPLYAGDLYAYIRAEDSFQGIRSGPGPIANEVAIKLILSGIVEGMLAMHSMGIVHRDLKTRNVLLEKISPGPHVRTLSNVSQPSSSDSPQRLSLASTSSSSTRSIHSSRNVNNRSNIVYLPSFPYNIRICDFGVCRIQNSVVSGQTFLNPFGISPRYAAPEVFARLFVPKASVDFDDEKKSDVYSFAIIIWEIITGLMPWHGLQNEEIQWRVCGGARPPLPSPEERPDGISEHYWAFLVELARLCWNQNPHHRPTFKEISEKLKAEFSL